MIMLDVKWILFVLYCDQSFQQLSYIAINIIPTILTIESKYKITIRREKFISFFFDEIKKKLIYSIGNYDSTLNNHNTYDNYYEI